MRRQRSSCGSSQPTRSSSTRVAVRLALVEDLVVEVVVDADGRARRQRRRQLARAAGVDDRVVAGGEQQRRHGQPRRLAAHGRAGVGEESVHPRRDPVVDQLVGAVRLDHGRVVRELRDRQRVRQRAVRHQPPRQPEHGPARRVDVQREPGRREDERARRDPAAARRAGRERAAEAVTEHDRRRIAAARTRSGGRRAASRRRGSSRAAPSERPCPRRS